MKRWHRSQPEGVGPIDRDILSGQDDVVGVYQRSGLRLEWEDVLAQSPPLKTGEERYLRSVEHLA